MTKRKCPKCKELKGFHDVMCGDCLWKEKKNEVTKSLHTGNIVRHIRRDVSLDE